MSDQRLTVDGQQYRIEDLSAEARVRVAGVQACDQRIQQLQQDLAIAQTARAAYINALKESLPAPVPEQVLDLSGAGTDQSMAAEPEPPAPAEGGQQH